MRVVDAHCDTLTAPGKLKNAYNVSRRFPFLQFYAVCTSEKGGAPEAQLREAKRHYERFAREWRGVLVTGAASLEKALAAPESAILTLEGADGISSEGDLDALVGMGMRVLNPVWNRVNRFASTNLESGTPADRGLTEEGKALVSAAEKAGVMIDVSHLSDRGFSDLCAIAKKPFLASHSNCRAVCPHPRNLTDAQMKELFSRGGVMGLNLYPPFVKEKGAALSDLFAHLDRALSLGGEDHVGLGLDIDGVEVYPEGASLEESIHDRFYEMTLARYGADLTEKLFYQNFAAFLRRHFKA
jgi:membrane dipeptidase